MLAVGSVLAGAGVLLVGLLALLFRHPRAPRWTRPEAVVFLIMVPVAGMIGIGSGLVLFGSNTVLRGEESAFELLVLVLVPVVVALVWHALRIGPRLRAYTEATAREPAIAALRPDAPAPGKPPHPPTQAAT